MEGTGGFFEADGARLYGVLHTPKGAAAEQGAVLVPPFMEERQDAHPVLRDAA
jgi:hypothetical protein